MPESFLKKCPPKSFHLLSRCFVKYAIPTFALGHKDKISNKANLISKELLTTSIFGDSCLVSLPKQKQILDAKDCTSVPDTYKSLKLIDSGQKLVFSIADMNLFCPCELLLDMKRVELSAVR